MKETEKTQEELNKEEKANILGVFAGSPHFKAIEQLPLDVLKILMLGQDLNTWLKNAISVNAPQHNIYLTLRLDKEENLVHPIGNGSLRKEDENKIMKFDEESFQASYLG